jgi:rhodanese-related sulfurtransferase/biotin operon repressor
MEDWILAERSDKHAVFDQLAAIAKAVGSGRRLELVELLAQGEHSVETLSRMTGMALTLVSAHLQTLKRTGLAATRKQGTTVFYRLAGEDVAQLYLAVKRVGLAHSPGLRHALAEYRAGGPREACPVRTIDPSAVTEAMLVLDVRPRIEYEAGHFPGALGIPLADLQDRAGELDRERQVVVYCRGEFCRLARDAAQWLCGQGFDAVAMDEGVIEWRAAGPVALDVIA